MADTLFSIPEPEVKLERPKAQGVPRLVMPNRSQTELRAVDLRDVTFAEDLSQIRTGAWPRVMATLRNLATSLIRLRDQTRGIAEALRDLAARPHLTLAMVGL